MKHKEKIDFVSYYPFACKEGVDELFAWDGTLEGFFLNGKKRARYYCFCASYNISPLPLFEKIVEIYGYRKSKLLLSSLLEVEGDIYSGSFSIIDLPNLEKIGGSVEVAKGSSFNLPSLKEIGENLEIRVGSTICLSSLERE